MSQKQELIDRLIHSFCDDRESGYIVSQLLHKHSTEWIQPQHVIQEMNGYLYFI